MKEELVQGNSTSQGVNRRSEAESFE